MQTVGSAVGIMDRESNELFLNKRGVPKLFSSEKAANQFIDQSLDQINYTTIFIELATNLCEDDPTPTPPIKKKIKTIFAITWKRGSTTHFLYKQPKTPIGKKVPIASGPYDHGRIWWFMTEEEAEKVLDSGSYHNFMSPKSPKIEEYAD